MTRLLVVILALAPLSWARDGDTADWQNLRVLASGQAVEIGKTGGEFLKGAFVTFNADSLTVRARGGELSIRKPDVVRVRLRGHRSRNTWIGAGIGAAAGAGIGVGIGDSVNNTSGGDFANLKPAIAGATAVVGAAVGAILGSVLSGRHSEVYRAR